MRTTQIAVIGESPTSGEAYAFGVELGVLLAKMGVIVITGGRGGIMEAVCKGVASEGGMAIAVLPTENLEDANAYANVVIPTGLGHARNNIIALSADLIIAIGGKAGTLTELGFGWIHEKPIIAITQFGGWSQTLAGQKIDDRQSGSITACHDLITLRKEIKRICAGKELKLD